MNVKRIITAEGPSGVAIQTDIFDTTAVDFLTNVWGFDRVPTLPLRPDQVLGAYRPKSIFGPHGGIRLDLFTLAPQRPGAPSELERAGNLDIGAASAMTPGKQGDGMHRTDSVDFVVVLEGEVNLGYPDENGRVQEMTLGAGDLVVQNGTFHSWHNRSAKNCTMLFIVLTTDRTAAA